MVLIMNENPLINYFRRPSIYITLPSKGKFYPEGTLELTPANELAIYPMTAIDEITYRTPDALFNGSSVPEVIKSCVPSIKDPWLMPSVDLPAILTAIRIASFGHEMELPSTCPKCKETAEYAIDLRHVLDNLGKPDFDKPFEVGDLKIYFRPLTYQEMNNNARVNFEEQQLTKLVQASQEVDESKKIELLSDAFKKVSAFTIGTLVKNIDRIETPSSIVTDPEYIDEYIRNCDRDVYRNIKKYIVSERSKADLKPLHIKCDHCGHEYDQPYTMDMSNFFE
jgi:hypothetical protein